LAPPRPFDLIAVVVCDSVGCGGAPDASAFGDDGANTLGHVVEHAQIELPNLAALGAERIPGVPRLTTSPPLLPDAAYGRMLSRSPAKDTMVGHWELMGVVADRAFPTYPNGFSTTVITEFERRIGLPTIGNRSASGTEILVELGAEHLRTGAPIVYTSGDSVFQLTAHTDRIRVKELHEMCAEARNLLAGEDGVGRVIARPFAGSSETGFERLSADRRDYALPPVRPTVLDHLCAASVPTHGVGKINDIFGGRGLTSYAKTGSNDEGIEATCQVIKSGQFPFIFTNLVDFDALYGHRNDVAGYGAALREFDAALPRLREALPDNGLLVITADHGNDPTWPGTDHTREAVPILAAGAGVAAVNLGTRSTFADLGATVLDNFRVDGATAGSSFLTELCGAG